MAAATEPDLQSLFVERQRKIAEYEQFINNTLMVDLQNVETARDDIYSQISQ